MKEADAAYFRRGRDLGPDDEDAEDDVASGVYVIPSIWDAVHVGVRMIHACRVIEACVGYVGQRRVKSLWPATMGGWRELLDESEQQFVIEIERRHRARRKVRGPLKIDWRAYVPSDLVRAREQDAAEIAARQRPQPSQIEVAFAEEALRWPSRFLGDDSLQADALMVWAWTKATGKSLERLLRARNKRADAKIAYRAAETSAARAARKKALAAEVLAWGREQSAGADDGDRTAILRAMQGRLHAAIRAEGLDEPVEPAKPAEIAPGQCYTRKSVDKFRAQGSARIAAGLRKEGRTVR